MPRHARYVEEIEQALSIKYNNRVYELKRQGVDVIVLSLGEAFFDIPLFSFHELPYPDLYHYSHSRGILELRERLAAYNLSEYGVRIDPETEMIITAGSKIGIHMAMMAVLEPGDEVIIHEPAWVSYTEQVRLCHATPVLIPQTATIEEYERYITPRTRIIVANYPHNPRGQTLSADDADRLHDLARRFDVYLLSDEAYSDFVVPPQRFISLALGDPEKEHTIICNSMSKNFGLSGWRVGYVVTNQELTSQILKINQHLITCPATILELYLARYFDEIIGITKPQIVQVVEKRQVMGAYMESIGLRSLPGAATFYFFVSIEDSGLDSETFCTRLLEKHGVSAVPGIGYGASCDQHIRVSVGTESESRTKVGLDRIRSLIEETASPAR